MFTFWIDLAPGHGRVSIPPFGKLRVFFCCRKHHRRTRSRTTWHQACTHGQQCLALPDCSLSHTPAVCQSMSCTMFISQNKCICSYQWHEQGIVCLDQHTAYMAYRDTSRYCTQQVNDNGQIPDSRPPRHCFGNDPNSFKCAMTAGKKRLTWFVVTNTCYKVYDNLMTICQTCWYRDASKSQLSAENQVLSLPCFVKKHYGVSLAEVEKTPLVLGKFCREFLKSLFLLASWKDGWTHLQQNILRKFVLGTEGQWDFLSGIGLGEVQFYLNQAKTRFVMNLFEPSLLCVRMKKTKKMRRHQLFFGCKYRRFPPGHWDGF